MLKLVVADLRSKQRLYAESGHICSIWKAVLADGTLAGVLYRASQWLLRLRLQPLAYVLQLLNKWINGCVIGLRADFGPGFVIVHPIGVVINGSVRGGCDIRIESSVVIGENRGRSPVLGDRIFIGTGAKVIGGISIGADARIGANAVVLHDVPPGVTVVGIPARAVTRGNPHRKDPSAP
jgi:serine O-acetyltransferase